MAVSDTKEERGVKAEKEERGFYWRGEGSPVDLTVDDASKIEQ